MLFRSPRALLAAAFALSGLTQAPLAAADDSAEPDSPEYPIGAPPPKKDEPPQLVAYRTDDVGGHLQLGLSGNVVLPFGSLSKDLGLQERAGYGAGGVVDISFGLDRFVALGAYAEMNWLGEANNCAGCSASMLGGGGFLRYHLAQGLKFDPWLSYGVGVMVLGADTGAENLHYAGLDWMRLTFGANWYALKNFVVGPAISVQAGHMTDRPSNEKVGGPFARATFGLRIAFDSPGRSK